MISLSSRKVRESSLCARSPSSLSTARLPHRSKVRARLITHTDTRRTPDPHTTRSGFSLSACSDTLLARVAPSLPVCTVLRRMRTRSSAGTRGASLFILFTLFFAPTHADCAVRAPRVSLSPLRALYSTTDGGRKQAPCGMSTTTAETACAGQGTPVTTTHTTARDNTDRRHARTVQGSLTTTT